MTAVSGTAKVSTVSVNVRRCDRHVVARKRKETQVDGDELENFLRFGKGAVRLTGGHGGNTEPRALLQSA